MRKELTAVLAFSVLLSGCLMGPNYKKPELDVPAGQEEDLGVFAKEKWWEMFNDPVLNTLEEEALANNKDLASAMAKVEEARAKLGMAYGDQLPTVDATGFAQRLGFAKSPSFGQYTAGLTAVYQLDFWGKYRRLSEAAKAQLTASEVQEDNVRLTLTADVANYYFAYITLKAQVEISEKTLESRKESVRIYQVRYKNGYSTEFDLKRVEAEMASVEASLEEFKRQYALSQTALSVLLGRTPREIIESKIEASPLTKIAVVPEVPAGIPADLLARRPDVRAAEALLIAANANVGVAKAAYFPSIVLTASGGYASGDLSDLIKPANSFWNAGAGLVLPVFHGGKIRNQHKQAQAVYKQMLAAYEKSAQIAYRDVYNALADNQHYRKIVLSNKKQAEALARSLDLAQKQQSAGLIDMLDLLDVERNLLNSQIALASARRNQLGALVSLSQALGGGWNDGVEEPVETKTAAKAEETEKAEVKVPSEEKTAPVEADKSEVKTEVKTAAVSSASAAEKKADAPKTKPVTFKYYGAGDKVSIVSGFTKRKPVAMKKVGGVWTKTLYIYPGEYRYKFIVDGIQILDPNAKAENGRSVLIVK